MAKRLDWIKLKNQFVVGGWVTVADFLRDNNLPNNSRSRTRTKGWKKEKLEYQGKIITQVQERTVESETEVRLRQQRIAKQLQEIGLKKLQMLEPESADEARKMVATGLQEERKAIGLEESTRNSSLTQVNINLPKTKFDELLDGQDLEGVLKLLAEVREEKKRRQLLKSQLQGDNIDTK